MRKQIPNMITSLNILSGSIAVMFAVAGDLVTAAWFVLLGIFFDFFDGLAARSLNAQSPVGLQLDSLADVITSGLAPAIVMVQLLNMSVIEGEHSFPLFNFWNAWNFTVVQYVPLIGLMIVVAAAYRLAKFNVDERQTTGFIGLPTPANALLILSLPLILQFQYSEWTENLILNHWFLLAITILGCVLMNAEIPLFALKFKTWNFKENRIRYIFLGLSVLSIIVLQFWAIPLILGLYVFLSVISKNQIT